MYSALITVFPSRNLIGEYDASVGIEAQMPGSAPSGEYFRLDVRLYGNGPGVLDTLYGAIRTLKPLIVG